MTVPAARAHLAADYELLARGLPSDIAAHARERYGVDLTGRYAGRAVKIPFGKASGQLSMTPRQVEQDAAAGLGFVVLKTVVAQDAAGARAMSDWALHESSMTVERITSRSGRLGWTVTWKGRGWDRSFNDYLALYRQALAIGAEQGMPVAASVKYHLPPLNQDFRLPEYEYTTRKLAQLGGVATIIEKDFSPTLAGDARARARQAILRWLREVPLLIRREANVTLGLKLMNAMFDDAFQAEMVREASDSGADFLVLFNRLFDAEKKVAYGGWDLSDRNLRVLDESHRTVPQIRGMYNGDRARKETLVEYGFRLPSALDNRPLKFDEFEKVMGSTIYTSATPAEYEMKNAQQVVEQIIRPTGLIDPEVVVRPVKGQVDDLVGEIKQRVERGERILVTTLTKRMAEDLTKYMKELGIKVNYLHSEVETLERVAILRDLRLGNFDVLVGINLLREGLDLPEVSLVAILDADKEGFLRSDTALIQTIGRAARNVNGRVIMYADRMTDSMKRAIDETNRRRAKQVKYNEENGIVPFSVSKAIHDLTEEMSAKAVGEMKGEYKVKNKNELPRNELRQVMHEMEKQMKEAAKNLEFEKAAALRDELYELKSLLAEDESLKPWERIKLLSGEEE